MIRICQYKTIQMMNQNSRMILSMEIKMKLQEQTKIKAKFNGDKNQKP